jgi:ATP-dependent RNA helicase RhlE
MPKQTSSGSSAPIADGPKKEDSFHGLGIAPQILRSLDHQGFKTPTPIQRDAIPIAAIGQDLIGIAQTGTGKTMAFGIPLAQQLMLQGGHALILVPTRELAFQVAESLAKITRPLNLRMAVLVGGELMYRQLRILKKNDPDIFIATPGRLNDILRRKRISLEKVRIVVLDEADRMLDMGFMPQIDEVMEYVTTERQTMLFSATMPAPIVKLADRYLKNPQRVEVAPQGSAAEQVSQELVVAPRDLKMDLLASVLREYPTGPVLIFSRTKEGAATLTKAVRRMGYTAAELHSERTLPQRRQALSDFKNGRSRVMVATDIAARGIDVTGISLVVNFDLPENAEDYVHRIGRTGRAGKGGSAISFATPEQGKEVRSIERLIRRSIPRSDRTSFVLQDSLVMPRGGRGGGRRNGNGRGQRQESEPVFTNISGPVGFTGPRSLRKRR